MQLHELTRNHPNKTKTRIGRGGKRGKTSGRGMKGQKARAGHRIRPEERDMIKKLPKLRGHGKNRSRTIVSNKLRPVAVNLAALELHFDTGDVISPRTLADKQLITKKSARNRVVKVLGLGNITKKLSVEKCAVSKSAREALEKVGGTVA